MKTIVKHWDWIVAVIVLGTLTVVTVARLVTEVRMLF